METQFTKAHLIIDRIFFCLLFLWEMCENVLILTFHILDTILFKSRYGNIYKYNLLIYFDE